jgi:hypothetical protein
MASTHRARALAKINRNSTPSVTGRANVICTGIGAHPTLFPSPNPSLGSILAQIVAVNNAEVTAATRAPGAAAARNVQRNLLVSLIEGTVVYVQGIADTCTSYDQAVSTIQAAGLVVAPVGKRIKALLALSQGPEPGSVVLDANARALTGGSQRKHCFNWGYSADGGKTFIGLPSTPKAKTTLDGLTPLTTYGFRVSLTTSDGIAGAWSQVVSFLVH